MEGTIRADTRRLPPDLRVPDAPPVMIIVCDNTDIAEVLYRNISGEETVEVVDDSSAAEAGEQDGAAEGQDREAVSPLH